MAGRAHGKATPLRKAVERRRGERDGGVCGVLWVWMIGDIDQAFVAELPIHSLLLSAPHLLPLSPLLTGPKLSAGPNESGASIGHIKDTNASQITKLFICLSLRGRGISAIYCNDPKVTNKHYRDTHTYSETDRQKDRQLHKHTHMHTHKHTHTFAQVAVCVLFMVSRCYVLLVSFHAHSLFFWCMTALYGQSV